MQEDEKASRHLMITSDSSSAIMPEAQRKTERGIGESNRRTGTIIWRERRDDSKEKHQVSTGSRETDGLVSDDVNITSWPQRSIWPWFLTLKSFEESWGLFFFFLIFLLQLLKLAVSFYINWPTACWPIHLQTPLSCSFSAHDNVSRFYPLIFFLMWTDIHIHIYIYRIKVRAHRRPI